MEGNTLGAFKRLLLELSGNDHISLGAVAKMNFQLGVLRKLERVSRCQERLLSEYFASHSALDGGSPGVRRDRGGDAWRSRIGDFSEADLSRALPDQEWGEEDLGYEAILGSPNGPRDARTDGPEAVGPRQSGDLERGSPEDVPAFPRDRTEAPRSDGGGAFVSARDLAGVAHVRSMDARRPSVGPEGDRGMKRSAGGGFVSPVVGRGDKSGADRGTPKNVEPKMVELIENEIVDRCPRVHWEDIAGLEFAKRCVQEMVVWPLLRPDIFTGLRRPARGLLLFGPPGTGKTLIGKCIASQAGATFFCISASSLTSKWVGEGEKMVRALFAVARSRQPSVVFIDEIDSLLSQRSESEHESSRRIKTEFLVQLDGAATVREDRVLVVGATNRPQELDEAARRRLPRRLYVPLPDAVARRQIVERLLGNVPHRLTFRDLEGVAARTAGYSGADVAQLCEEAALGPVRELSVEALCSVAADQVRPVDARDFDGALTRVRPSVSPTDLDAYVEWNSLYGSTAIEDGASRA